MAEPVPVLAGLWQIELGLVNAYLIEAEEGLVLVDTGSPGAEAEIYDAVAAIGRQVSDVRHVVITHHHADHAGSLAAVLGATGAEAWMHPADAAETRVGNAMRPYRVTSGLVNWALERILIRPSPAEYVPARVVHEVSDGDLLPGGFVAIHTPGHTAGHLSLWTPERGLLIVGDACTNLPVLTLSIVYEDLDVGRDSLRRLAELDIDTAVFGHGKPIVEGTREKFQAAFG